MSLATACVHVYLWISHPNSSLPRLSGTYRACILVVFVQLACASSLRAQLEGNVWYFALGAGIDFNGPSPVALDDGALRQPEGSAVACDPSGRLLFYTDGVTVWNRLHQPMPNGRGLQGHESSTQSALVVPAPCSTERYYVFTADVSGGYDPPNDGIHYSLVDMEADGGLGDVIVRNVPVIAPASEKLTAIRHANGIDYWVVVHEWQSNLYLAWLVSQTGVATVPVRSYTGTVFQGLDRYSAGYMKGSPDGRHLAMVMSGSVLELFDFDSRTGLISNPIKLSDQAFYGVSFSPDSRFLYAAEDTLLYQFDIAAGGSAAIQASRTQVGSGHLYAMQIAPDGRIYIVGNSVYFPEERGWMATIDNPNAAGSACGFNRQGFRLAVAGVDLPTTQGLPNFIDSYLDGLVRPCGPPTARIGADDPLCAGSCADFRDSSIGVPTSWEWSFPGATPSISNDENPTGICYGQAGSYVVKLVVHNAVGTDTVERTITVRAPADIRASASDVEGRPGDTLTIEARMDAAAAPFATDTLTLSMEYDASMVAPVGLDATGWLLDGWTISTTQSTPGRLILGARAPSGRLLTAIGPLLRVRFATWIGANASTPLPLSIEMPGMECGRVVGDSGRITLSICGLSSRAIEPLGTLVSAAAAGENPFRDKIELEIRLSGEDRVRATIFDGAGARIATIADGSFDGGAHRFEWDARQRAAGIYRCLIETPTRALSIPLIVVR